MCIKANIINNGHFSNKRLSNFFAEIVVLGYNMLIERSFQAQLRKCEEQ